MGRNALREERRVCTLHANSCKVLYPKSTDDGQESADRYITFRPNLSTMRIDLSAGELNKNRPIGPLRDERAHFKELQK